MRTFIRRSYNKNTTKAFSAFAAMGIKFMTIVQFKRAVRPPGLKLRLHQLIKNN